jgi:Dienelactone hydrolase family
VQPAELPRLVTAPLLVVAGTADRTAARARDQIEEARRASPLRVETQVIEGARHNFLSRDLRAYDLPKAEVAWLRIVAFLKQHLSPPPPKPPAVPKPAVQAGADEAGKVRPVPTAPVRTPPPTPPPKTPPLPNAPSPSS